MTGLQEPPETPRVFAHRGASGHAPENTLAAFRKAADLDCRWIETDCMLTRDGRVILHHDDTLLRVAGVDLPVGSTDYSDMQTLDCGSWFDPEFAQERIPLLEQAIDLFSDLGMGINLELKPCPGAEAETARAVATIVTRFWPNHLPPPIVSSFSLEAFQTAWPLLPDSPFAMLWQDLPENWEAVMKDNGADALHLDADALEEQHARILSAEGMVFRCYTVNENSRFTELMEWGAEAVFSDLPDRLTPTATA